jgi:6-phosphogluconolactonase
VTPPTVIVHRDAELLAKAVAARIVTRLVDVQAARGSASIVLTGGDIGSATLRHLRASPARDAIDWHRLDVWWGDERYLPAGDPERNETQAREALLDAVPIDPARVHAIPGPGSSASTPEDAADRYADQLAAATSPEDHGDVPRFDLLLLGVGGEGHVASLFPSAPAVYDDRSVVAVRGCPKPPPIRVSLTLRAINCASEVWLVTAGEEKARAVRLALSGAGPLQLPAAGVAGRARTLWLLDRGAASQVPRDVARPASP